jgi:hypothetical protein
MPRSSCEDDMKIDHLEEGCKNGDSIKLAWDEFQVRDLVIILLKHGVP